MKMSKLVGDRFKERPADASVESHALMVRGGYIKQVANGIYTLLPPAKRITAKIEKILREEMALCGKRAAAGIRSTIRWCVLKTAIIPILSWA